MAARCFAFACPSAEAPVMNDDDRIADDLIAVVDDDPAVLASVGALLGASGYRARCFATADAFLAACPLDSVGCVITDLRIPGITGDELQRRLLAAESALAVVVV